MMVTILSCILSGAWAAVEQTRRPTDSTAAAEEEFDQTSMGHFFAAVQIEAFQPLARFCSGMDAMMDALHKAPPADLDGKVCYPGEIEAATAIERSKNGIPITERLFDELETLADDLGLQMPSAHMMD